MPLASECWGLWACTAMHGLMFIFLRDRSHCPIFGIREWRQEKKMKPMPKCYSMRQSRDEAMGYPALALTLGHCVWHSPVPRQLQELPDAVWSVEKTNCESFREKL